MAKVSKDEIEPPVTDFGPIGPIRCIRCKAYMCSLMQFIDGGNFRQIVLKDLPVYRIYLETTVTLDWRLQKLSKFNHVKQKSML